LAQAGQGLNRAVEFYIYNPANPLEIKGLRDGETVAINRENPGRFQSVASDPDASQNLLVIVRRGNTFSINIVSPDPGSAKGRKHNATGWGGGYFRKQLDGVQLLMNNGKAAEAQALLRDIWGAMAVFHAQIQEAKGDTARQEVINEQFMREHGITDPLQDPLGDLSDAMAMATALATELGAELTPPAAPAPLQNDWERARDSATGPASDEPGPAEALAGLARAGAGTADSRRKPPRRSLGALSGGETGSPFEAGLREADRILNELGVSQGCGVVNVGARGMADISLGLAAARRGAHYVAYDMRTDFIGSSCSAAFSAYDTEEFGGSAKAIVGEFSSRENSRSRSIADHSQDVILVLSGALADPGTPESDPAKIIEEIERVSKHGGKLVAGTFDTDWRWNNYAASLEAALRQHARKATFTRQSNMDIWELGKSYREAVVYLITFGDGDPQQAGHHPLAPGQGGGVAETVGNDPGGIDFRALPIITQPLGTAPLGGQPKMGTGTAPVALEKQWREIERMLQAGIRPSTDRIKEYVKAIEGQYNAETPRPIGGPGVPPSAEIDKVLSCIADILRQEEQECYSTEPALRQLLALLESGDPLGPGLEKVQPLPKEPKGKRE
jgi:SAM-dependent methyltransferase